MVARRPVVDQRLLRGQRRMVPGSLEGRSEQAQPPPSRPSGSVYKSIPGFSLNTQTGTSYTLVIGDRGVMVIMTNGSANTVTIPPSSSVPFPIATTLEVLQYGAGQTTIAAGAGVTRRAPGGVYTIAEQYGAVTLTKIGANEWHVLGTLG